MTQSHFPTIEAANSALIAKGNVDSIGEYFSSDYVAHVTDGDHSGHKTVGRYITTLRRAFPDIEVEVDLLVENADRIAWQRTLRGTQKCAFQDFSACDRQIIWRDMVTSRLHDGLIAEEWIVTDLAERLLRAQKS